MSITTANNVKRLESIVVKLMEIEPLIRPNVVFCKVTDTFKSLKEAVHDELRAAVWDNYLSEKGG
jgi:hypothetical protein